MGCKRTIRFKHFVIDAISDVIRTTLSRRNKPLKLFGIKSHSYAPSTLQNDDPSDVTKKKDYVCD